jgi:multicomponent Na+:H+ antiporter subunit B
LKFLYFVIAAVTGLFLVYGAMDMPGWGDPMSPASLHVSPRYIEKAFEETEVPNMVTAVLADYRGYDTLGETTVIFAAGVCCLLILGRRRGGDDSKESKKSEREGSA